jgi:hypothetical protein
MTDDSTPGRAGRPAPLTTHNAQITTATVQIKTLTIGGKQVTLAVFRQLIEEQLIDADGNLNGVPWGTINYHPDKCGADDGHHLHAVWQQGTVLRRSRIDQPDWWRARFYSESSDGYVQAIYCLRKHSEPDDWRHIRVEGDRCLEFTLDDIRCETMGMPERREHECLTEPDRDESLKWLRQDVAEEHARRERITGHWKALNDLPQLFIAV